MTKLCHTCSGVFYFGHAVTVCFSFTSLDNKQFQTLDISASHIASNIVFPCPSSVFNLALSVILGIKYYIFIISSQTRVPSELIPC